MIGRLLTAAAAAMVLAATPAMGLAAPAKTPARAPVPPPAPPAPVVYIAEALHTGPVQTDLVERLRPLHTLLEIELLLKATDTPFAWRKIDLDTATLPPGLTQSLANLPPREPFILPQKDGGLTMAVIIGKR